MILRFARIFVLCLLLAAVCSGARADEKQAPDKPAADKQMPDKQMEDTGIVVLRTIDKLSARTHTFDIPVDKTVKFGNSLFIKARACRKSSPLDLPESAAFLQIWERKPSEEKSRWLFSGWMFASSPSLSRLDHAVYDVWVIECKNATTSKSEEFSSETAPNSSPDARPLSGSKEDIGFVEGAAPDKASDRVEPGKSPEPATDKPATDSPAARPATDTPAAAAPKPAAAPLSPATRAPAAKPAVPPLEQLPGSFDDGDNDGDGKGAKDDLPSGGD